MTLMRRERFARTAMDVKLQPVVSGGGDRFRSRQLENGLVVHDGGLAAVNGNGVGQVRLALLRIRPLQQFARAIKSRLHGLLAHRRYPINSGVLEGINNKVKVIRRIAYGYRDHDYFFLKIRSHFTGIDPL